MTRPSLRRRGVMAGGFIGGLLALAGCGQREPSTIEKANEAARQVEHVTNVDLVFTGGTGLREGISGRIELDVNEDQLLEALDPAWRAVTEVLFEAEGDEPVGRIVQVGVQGADGSWTGPEALINPAYYEQARTAYMEEFYEHYGLI